MKEAPDFKVKETAQRIRLPGPPVGSEIHQQPTPWSKWYEKDHTIDTR